MTRNLETDPQLDVDARDGATGLWNQRACGELEGDQASLEYFRRVEADRYAQQGWAPAYFEYSKFAGKTVLEIGVGQGTDLAQFGAAGAICHGVDITDNHLELTRRNFAARGLEVDLRKSDATRLPFPDAYFDCVYSFGVMHHIPEIEKVVAEIERVLKPGGTFRMALYYKWSGFHLLSILLRGLVTGRLFRLGYSGMLATIEMGADGKKIKPYVRLWSKRDVRQLLRRFRIDDISVHQAFLSHFVPWLGPVRDRELPFADRLGWYVASIATKK